MGLKMNDDVNLPYDENGSGTNESMGTLIS